MAIDLTTLGSSFTDEFGVVFNYTDSAGAGTGQFSTFLVMQPYSGQSNTTDLEEGFNTDASPLPMGDIQPEHTNAVLLSTIPTVQIGEITYYQIKLDVNEPNNGSGTPIISWDALKLYQGTTGSPADLAHAGTLVYSSTNTLTLDDHGSGSSDYDYTILIPTSTFTPGGGDYLTLYARFTDAQGGFEEFGLGEIVSPQSGAITIDKETVDDTISGDGLNILAGESIQWKYVVTNTGNTALANVTVVDDMGTASDLTDDQTITIGSLAAGASTTVYLSGVALTGSYSNNALASGTWTDTSNVIHATTDSDDSSYTGWTPAIAIDKETVDDTISGDGLNILAGESIQWKYVVTNTGNVALANVTVVDDMGTLSLADDQTVNIGNLAAGASTTVYLNGVAQTGSYSNSATASGTSIADSAGHTMAASASDDSSYFGADPEITIAKTTVTSHNSGDGIKVFAGESVKWHYEVTNAGNVALSDVIVSDNRLGVIPTYVSGDDGNGELDLGETWIYEASGTAIKGAYSNKGTATGDYTDSAGHIETDAATDGSSYCGLGAATPGLSKGYWANHDTSWSGKASPNLIIGDSNLDGIANDSFNLSIVKAGAVLMTNSSTLGDARVIMGGQAAAAQLNAYAAGVTANGLLDKAGQWFSAFGGQDDKNVVAGEYGNDKKNGFTFSEGSKITTDKVAAWKGDFFTFSYNSNEDGGTSHTVGVTGEGLKNILMAYDHGISGTNDGLVVSSDGSLIGWQKGSVIEHVYANTANAFVAVINEAEHHGDVSLVGIYDKAGYNNVG